MARLGEIFVQNGEDVITVSVKKYEEICDALYSLTERLKSLNGNEYWEKLGEAALKE